MSTASPTSITIGDQSFETKGMGAKDAQKMRAALPPAFQKHAEGYTNLFANMGKIIGTFPANTPLAVLGEVMEGLTAGAGKLPQTASKAAHDLLNTDAGRQLQASGPWQSAATAGATADLLGNMIGGVTLPFKLAWGVGSASKKTVGELRDRASGGLMSEAQANTLGTVFAALRHEQEAPESPVQISRREPTAGDRIAAYASWGWDSTKAFIRKFLPQEWEVTIIAAFNFLTSFDWKNLSLGSWKDASNKAAKWVAEDRAKPVQTREQALAETIETRVVTAARPIAIQKFADLGEISGVKTVPIAALLTNGGVFNDVKGGQQTMAPDHGPSAPTPAPTKGADGKGSGTGDRITAAWTDNVINIVKQTPAEGLVVGGLVTAWGVNKFGVAALGGLKSATQGTVGFAAGMAETAAKGGAEFVGGTAWTKGAKAYEEVLTLSTKETALKQSLKTAEQTLEAAKDAHANHTGGRWDKLKAGGEVDKAEKALKAAEKSLAEVTAKLDGVVDPQGKVIVKSARDVAAEALQNAADVKNNGGAFTKDRIKAATQLSDEIERIGEKVSTVVGETSKARAFGGWLAQKLPFLAPVSSGFKVIEYHREGDEAGKLISGLETGALVGGLAKLGARRAIPGIEPVMQTSNLIDAARKGDSDGMWGAGARLTVIGAATTVGAWLGGTGGAVLGGIGGSVVPVAGTAAGAVAGGTAGAIAGGAAGASIGGMAVGVFDLAQAGYNKFFGESDTPPTVKAPANAGKSKQETAPAPRAPSVEAKTIPAPAPETKPPVNLSSFSLGDDDLNAANLKQDLATRAAQAQASQAVMKSKDLEVNEVSLAAIGSLTAVKKQVETASVEI
jgi:hypothetical protein